jgi:hypothetical protein
MRELGSSSPPSGGPDGPRSARAGQPKARRTSSSYLPGDPGLTAVMVQPTDAD